MLWVYINIFFAIDFNYMLTIVQMDLVHCTSTKDEISSFVCLDKTNTHKIKTLLCFLSPQKLASLMMATWTLSPLRDTNLQIFFSFIIGCNMKLLIPSLLRSHFSKGFPVYVVIVFRDWPTRRSSSNKCPFFTGVLSLEAWMMLLR